MVYGPLFVVLLGLRNLGNRFSTAGTCASTDPRIKAACLLPQVDVPCLFPISPASVFPVRGVHSFLVAGFHLSWSRNYCSVLSLPAQYALGLQ